VELFLDPTDGRPRSVQIYEQLRNAIVEGRLTARDRLAPTRTVAAELGVSRSTVTEAYGRLSAEGYIEGRAGGGSVVGPVRLTPTRPRQPAEALTPTPRAAGVRPYNPRPTFMPPSISGRDQLIRRCSRSRPGGGASSARSTSPPGRTGIQPGRRTCAPLWPPG
jgi:DNA-binding transcriptional MocR family regulator